MMKKIIKKVFYKLGYDIKKVEFNSYTSQPKFLNRLNNLKNLGFNSSVIVDGGAHLGNWTKQVIEFFPKSKYLLVEPNPLLKVKIDENLKKSNVDYCLIQKALGAKSGNGMLNIWENVDENLTGSSICSHVRGKATKKIECEIITLDSILIDHSETPNFIKLDLQGYELQALNGAKKLLESCELFIIEFGCLEAYIERTSIKELIELMYDNSYVLYDIIELHYRPYDNALTGGDFIFIKNSSKLKKYKGWE